MQKRNNNIDIRAMNTPVIIAVIHSWSMCSPLKMRNFVFVLPI